MNDKLKNGYETEEKFILECLQRNIPISRPIFNVEPYDFVIEVNKKLLSIQVKKSWVDKKGRNIVCIKSSYPRSSKTKVINKESVDYLAVLVECDWYIIPCSEFEGKVSNLAISQKGAYAKYYNNWEFK